MVINQLRPMGAPPPNIAQVVSNYIPASQKLIALQFNQNVKDMAVPKKIRHERLIPKQYLASI